MGVESRQESDLQTQAAEAGDYMALYAAAREPVNLNLAFPPEIKHCRVLHPFTSRMLYQDASSSLPSSTQRN